MQPTIEPIRAHLTSTQVAWLIEGSPDVQIGAGLEITDLSQVEVTDISDDFAGGVVERQSYATLHGTFRFGVSVPIDWGWAVVKPYMTLTDGAIEARFNLGAYFTNTPRRPTKEQPPTWDVTAYDLLYRLDTIVGDAYSVGSGVVILDRVEEILLQRGYTRYIIDRSRGTSVTTDVRTWALDQSVHWLTIVNNLLGMVGYQGVWSDWNGYLRCEPYQRPIDRPYEWYLSADQYESILGNEAEIEFDFHTAPNRWVGYRSNSVEGSAPVEGNGIYTFTNNTVGPTSVDARRGMVITRQEGLEVVSHLDLITGVQSMADADMSVPTRISTTTGPHPLFWHFDRILVNDPDIGVPSEVVSTQWSLPLNGDDMGHQWAVISGVRS